MMVNQKDAELVDVEELGKLMASYLMTLSNVDINQS